MGGTPVPHEKSPKFMSNTEKITRLIGNEMIYMTILVDNAHLYLTV